MRIAVCTTGVTGRQDYLKKLTEILDRYTWGDNNIYIYADQNIRIYIIYIYIKKRKEERINNSHILCSTRFVESELNR